MPYLTKADEIRSIIPILASAKILWLDTETADWKSPCPRISLIQALAESTDLTGEQSYVLDVLDRPDLVDYFISEIMVNPQIEKVFHNAKYDVNFLGQEQAQNISCTWRMAKKLKKKKSAEIVGLTNLKLKTMAAELCGFSNVDQEQQSSDWGQRPLTDRQLQYAKMDPVYLAQVHRRLLELRYQAQIAYQVGRIQKSQMINWQNCSFSVTKVRVAFECPRLFYLGHRFGGMMMFRPAGNPPRIGAQFHHLADHLAFIAKQEPRFQELFELAADQLNGEAIAQQLQQLFYELAFFPHLQAVSKSAPGKAPVLFQLWEGLKGLIHRWAQLLVQNRRYCSAAEVIDKTLIALKPSVKHHFQLADGTQQLVQGRFDSLVYDFEHHRLCVVEYKTYQSPDKSAQMVQAALYSYMLREKLGVPVDSAVYTVLPNWDELTFTWDELENTVHQLIPQKLQQMRQWIAWEISQTNPPPPTPHPQLFCDICPQKRKCQAYFAVDVGENHTPDGEAVFEKDVGTPGGGDGEKINVTGMNATWYDSTSPEVLPIAQNLVTILQSFNIGVDYQGVAVGPAFIRVKLKPHLGVKVGSLLRLSADLQVQLGIANPPLIAPQAGYVSIDLPRFDPQIARFEEYMQPGIRATTSLRIAIGVNLEGELVEADLSDPNTCHLLVGGTTGSGKSEFLRSLLLSLLYRHSPQQLQIALVDPKRVTFSEFEQIPWLRSPIVKDSENAIELMDNLVTEMEQRYQQFEKTGCDNLTTYNQKIPQPLPHLVCIFDEYADFMAQKDTRKALELNIKRLGAMARAAGIHLIIATQRPEASIITPIIRSNLPGRIALRTASEADSMIILGTKQTAAAYLLGKGDLLYQVGAQLHRLQSLLSQKIQLTEARN